MPICLKLFYNQLKNIIALLLHKFVKVVNNIFKMANQVAQKKRYGGCCV
jgi:hypothetical protein